MFLCAQGACANGRCRGPDPQALNLRASIAEREAALRRQLGGGDMSNIDQEIETRMARTRQVKQALLARAGLADHVRVLLLLIDDNHNLHNHDFPAFRLTRVMTAFSNRTFCSQRCVRVCVFDGYRHDDQHAHKQFICSTLQDQANVLINQINNGPTNIPSPGGGVRRRHKRSAVFMEENFSKQWPIGRPIPFKFDPKLSECSLLIMACSI